MYKIIAFFILVTLSFSACDSKKTELEKVASTKDLKNQAQLLNDFLKKYEEPSQTFTVPSDSVSKITGKQGTIIEVNPEDLVTEDGSLIKGNIVVELKELTNQQQLLNSNAQTVSDGKLLVSGGAYYINMTSEGKSLKLKENKTLSVNFSKKAKEEMALFYGQRDSLNNLDWKEANQNFQSTAVDTFYVAYLNTGDSILLFDTDIAPDGSVEESRSIVAVKRRYRKLTKAEKKKMKQKEEVELLEAKVYDAVRLTKLGWINCDRFYEIAENDKTDLEFIVDGQDDILYATVYVVFKDINSVMSTTYVNWKDTKRSAFVDNLPIGSKVKVVAFSTKEGKMFADELNLTIEKDKPVKLQFKAVDEKEIRKMLSAN